ncbi:MAG: methylcrotonoyl-CoA carboxylase, partial [Robiginitomaculum sp.]
SARREALGAFGDDKVLVERFITNPRHIEVQVFGDGQGNVVHFFERDCSVQRRHQKVIEEAPAPGMSDEMRAAMCDAAIRAASAVNYANAGTVEFIVDGSAPLDPAKFWFMEMNTRLQVEHPVTEALTGFDLVQLQLEIAAGGALPSQDRIRLSGHAMEARLYAEQPAKGFLPSTGVLQHFVVETGADLRLDTGFEQGDVVSEHYDPMLAKVIAVGADRTQAVERLCAALQSVQIWPIQTNAGFLVQILRQPVFADGLHDTGFIAANLDDLIEPDVNPASRAAHLALAMFLQGANQTLGDPWAQADGWRVNQSSQVFRRLQIDGQNWDTRLQIIGANIEIDVDGTQFAFDRETHGVRLDLVQIERQWVGFFDGLAQACLVPDAEADTAALDALDTISAPMPGKILEVRTELGHEVVQGEVLVVMEAMKMEHALAAPRDGIVSELSCAAGDQVKENTILVALASTENPSGE